jgi:lipopolysaccharide export LptBFGC system permease protein LptF
MFKLFLKNDKGEAYVGESVKIVIAIVLGAALLAGAVLVFNQVILPRTEGYIETLFGEAEETVEKIDSVYGPILSYMRTEINTIFDEMDAEEMADFEAEIEATREDYPDAFPPNFSVDDFRDGKTFMNVCYAVNEDMTYDEAVAFSETTEGKATYAEYFDGWFD